MGKWEKQGPFWACSSTCARVLLRELPPTTGKSNSYTRAEPPVRGVPTTVWWGFRQPGTLRIPTSLCYVGLELCVRNRGQRRGTRGGGGCFGIGLILCRRPRVKTSTGESTMYPGYTFSRNSRTLRKQKVLLNPGCVYGYLLALALALSTESDVLPARSPIWGLIRAPFYGTFDCNTREHIRYLWTNFRIWNRF